MRRLVRGWCRWILAFIALSVVELAVGAKEASAKGLKWREEAELVDDVASSPYFFGVTLGVSGAFAVVGEPEGGAGGAVHVFHQVAGTWQREARIPAPEGALSFAWTLALNGQTLAVSAGDEGAGVVYVYVRGAGPAWTLQARIASPSAEALCFGRSVALAGDTLVVGSPFEGTGAVYVFVRSGGTWALTARLLGHDTAEGDVFGTSVAYDGLTIVVGAPGHAAEPEEGGAAYHGAAYVFTGGAGRWVEEAELEPVGSEELHIFGQWVAVAGDVVVAGSASSVAGAHVFERTTAGWVEDAQFQGTVALGGFEPQHVLAASGNRIVFGAPWCACPPFTYPGEIYVFERTKTGAWDAFEIVEHDLADDEYEGFGHAVAIDGRTLLVSSPYDDDVGEDAGTVHVYKLY